MLCPAVDHDEECRRRVALSKQCAARFQRYRGRPLYDMLDRLRLEAAEKGEVMISRSPAVGRKAMFEVPRKPALLDRQPTEFILPTARVKGAFRRMFLPCRRSHGEAHDCFSFTPVPCLNLYKIAHIESTADNAHQAVRRTKPASKRASTRLSIS